MLRKIMIWAVFLVFAVTALTLSWHEGLFSFTGPLSAGKVAIWAVFLIFLGYSIHCTFRENFFRSFPQVLELHWGRQIVLDLGLGLCLMLFIVYLHEGSMLVVMLWFLPALAFGNLATLLYVAIHYDTLVATFLA
jgi:hypothetical protein